MSLDADRLRKVAALLTSPVDGEALSALRRATHILGQAGISIADAVVDGSLRRAPAPSGRQEPAPAPADPEMPEKAMVCRFTVVSEEELAGGLGVMRVIPTVVENGVAKAYRECLAVGRVAATIRARLFQDPSAEFVAKFSVPFRTHREDPKVTSVQAIA